MAIFFGKKNRLVVLDGFGDVLSLVEIKPVAMYFPEEKSTPALFHDQRIQVKQFEDNSQIILNYIIKSLGIR